MTKLLVTNSWERKLHRILTIEDYSTVSVEESERQEACPVRAHEGLPIARTDGQPHKHQHRCHDYHRNTGGEILSPGLCELTHVEIR